MTAIAYDGRYIAIDSQVTAGDTKYQRHKAFEITTPEGGLLVAFGCGGVSDIEAAVDALRNGETIPRGDFTLLVFEPETSTLSEYVGSDKSSSVLYDHYGAGSGDQAVLGALKAGASAAKAVEIACMVNVSCGGPVVVYDTKTKRFKTSRSGKTSP